MSQQPPNLKLIAIFAVPLLLVTALLQASKRFVDVFDDGENIDALVKQAKVAGFPFEASELAVKGVPDSNNAYLPLKQYFLDEKNPVPNTGTELTDFWLLGKKELEPGMAELAHRAKAVASKTQFDAKRDYDQSYGLLFPEYAKLKQVTKVLCYDAAHRARHGDDAGALASMQLAKNSALLLSEDKPLIGMLVTIACQSIFYASVANVAHEMRGRPESLRKLLALLDKEIPTGSYDDAMKYEFYTALAWLRNANSAQLLVADNTDFEFLGDQQEEPKERVRSGLPASAIGRSLLSKMISRFLQYDQIRKGETDRVKLAQKLDAFSDQTRMSLSERVIGTVSPAYGQANLALLKPAIYREFARWAIQIAIDHPNRYPDSLPPRRDPSFGGELHYVRLGSRVHLYTSGPDKVDNGGVWLDEEKSNTKKGDDFGFTYPVKPRMPIKPTEPTLMPGNGSL